jgi:hypothetical protein
LSGKKAGKEEGFVGKLTAGSVCAEGGRRGKIDERGRSSGQRQWQPAMAGPIPAGFGRDRAREWVEEVKSEARDVRARRIEAGSTGMAGAASGGSSARALRDASARKKMRRGENEHDSVEIRTGTRARRARFADG